MIRKIKVGLLGITGIIVLLILGIIIWYQVYKQKATDQPSNFDLFIAETFLKNYKYGDPFGSVAEEQKRPIEWQLKVSQFEFLDTLVLSIKNLSGEKFYYTSWGAPFSRIRTEFIFYKNGQADTIPFGGFDCGTGVYLAPIMAHETITKQLIIR